MTTRQSAHQQLKLHWTASRLLVWRDALHKVCGAAGAVDIKGKQTELCETATNKQIKERVERESQQAHLGAAAFKQLLGGGSFQKTPLKVYLCQHSHTVYIIHKENHH